MINISITYEHLQEAGHWWVYQNTNLDGVISRKRLNICFLTKNESLAWTMEARQDIQSALAGVAGVDISDIVRS